jgi:hypothetical protein
MRKKKQINKLKILTPFQKKRVRGGCQDNNGSNGGVPPYEPGGNKDKDKDQYRPTFIVEKLGLNLILLNIFTLSTI